MSDAYYFMRKIKDRSELANGKRKETNGNELVFVIS